MNNVYLNLFYHGLINEFIFSLIKYNVKVNVCLV